MKAWFMGVAALALAASALSPAAQVDGPRPSSANNWPGMTNTDPAGSHAGAAPQQAEPHYVWQEGYSHHGRWVGSWVLVR